MDENGEALRGRGAKAVLSDRSELLRQLHALPGSKILNRILELDNPRRVVQGLSSVDFFWLVKKVGENDCVALLELASVDQWQYLLDLEIWRKDRLDGTHSWTWIKRLLQADPVRLVKWLFTEQNPLISYQFFRSIEVVVLEESDEIHELPEGFFSLDGLFQIRIVDPGHRDTIEGLIRQMAKVDFDRYQALLLGLAGVNPAEMEEEMYRLRKVRLAEHGFLPFEDAIGVYAPLDPDALRPGRPLALQDVLMDEEARALVPLSPLYSAERENILTEAVSIIKDPLFLDRIRLEFAGLCNQIMAAEGLLIQEFEVLIRTCGKAAGYLNLALERLGGKDLNMAEKLLRSHSLVSLFRVGFGLALKLKWEAERWLKESWFYGQGLDTDFWGDQWGGILSGVLEDRPRYYAGLKGGEYKDFEWLSELGDCLKIIRCLMVLDGLMERLAESYPQDEKLMQSSELTFRPLIFNLWGRHVLGLEPGFSGISLSQAKTLLQRLRGASKRPPYRMRGFKEIFIRDYMAYASDAQAETASVLMETLSLIWQEFREEYAWVSLKDLDPRYSKLISIIPSDPISGH